MCADSNTWIAFFANIPGADVDALRENLINSATVMSPIVLSELFSDPNFPASYRSRLTSLQLLEIHEGFWERSGILRASLIKRRLKAKLADTLIAQLCIDHRVSLVTRDRDFTHFARYAGLKLAGTNPSARSD
ncbi:MAG: type II toxin-antitoxin system VapC family toxin [Bryobacteraceae bacterium]